MIHKPVSGQAFLSLKFNGYFIDFVAEIGYNKYKYKVSANP